MFNGSIGGKEWINGRNTLPALPNTTQINTIYKALIHCAVLGRVWDNFHALGDIWEVIVDSRGASGQPKSGLGESGGGPGKVPVPGGCARERRGSILDPQGHNCGYHFGALFV